MSRDDLQLSIAQREYWCKSLSPKLTDVKKWCKYSEYLKPLLLLPFALTYKIQKTKIFRIFLKGIKASKITFTSANNFSSNKKTQLFLLILSIKFSACSERYSSNAFWYSLAERNKIVGKSFLMTSLYVRCKENHLIVLVKDQNKNRLT